MEHEHTIKDAAKMMRAFILYQNKGMEAMTDVYPDQEYINFIKKHKEKHVCEIQELLNPTFTLENYISDLIWKRELELMEMYKDKQDYNDTTFKALFYRLTGAIADFRMCETGYANVLSQVDREVILKNKEKKDKKRTAEFMKTLEKFTIV